MQGCGGTRLRQLFTLRLMLVSAFGQAGTALAELLVFAPVGLQLGAFGQQAGVPVGFVGEALLFLLFARGGFAGARHPAGDPCVKGFGSDILGSDVLSGEVFRSLRLRGFLSIRVGSIQERLQGEHFYTGTFEVAALGVFVLGDVLLSLFRFFKERVEELLVVFDGEHLLEQFFAFFRLGLEELRELALRQEYDLEELFLGQVGAFGDSAVDFGDAAGDGSPGFFIGGVGAGCEFGEGCFGAFFAHLAFAGTAGDGLVVGGGAVDAQALAVEGHVE